MQGTVPTCPNGHGRIMTTERSGSIFSKDFLAARPEPEPITFDAWWMTPEAEAWRNKVRRKTGVKTGLLKDCLRSLWAISRDTQ